MTIRGVGLLVLAACWIAWAAPFYAAARRRKSQIVTAKQPAANWGILLQTSAYMILWLRAFRLFAPPAPLIVASMLLAFVSASCSWAAVRHLGANWRLQAALREDHTLVRTGPYRLVRHPIYASMLGMLIATGLLSSPWPLLLIALCVFLAGTEIRVRAEDALLAQRFGAEFEAYRTRVPAYIPFVR